MMKNIDLEVGNNAQNILPVPYFEKPVPNVESPHDFGKAPYGLAPPSYPTSKSRLSDDIQYCNFLSPAPRDPQMNVPNEGNKYCPSSKPQPYFKDSCYLKDSKSQGTVGIVCNQAGGSDNANFARGNQFGVDYSNQFSQMENRKKWEYTVERPTQIPMQLENPLVVYDNKPDFFPAPYTEYRKGKDFLTYPLQNNYTEGGDPTYVFPYKTLNSPFDNINFIEKFENEYKEDQVKNGSNFFILLIFVLLILYFIFCCKKR